MNIPTFMKNVPLEYQLLWQASKKKRLDNREMRDLLQRAIRDARNKTRNRAQDALAYKLNSFGNSGDWGLSKLRELSRAVFNDKAPEAIDLGEWISVEIECVFQSEPKENDFVAFVRKNGFTKMVTIKDDGSIRKRECECSERDDEGNVEHDDDCDADDRRAYGRELVLTFKYGQWDFVQAICNKLNKLGCTVNKSCGLHVHFDMRHQDNARKVGTIAQRVAKAVPALKQMLPASRSNNRFCARDVNTMRSGSSDSRYAFVNIQSYSRHKTLEIRGHSGTTDPTKIINWIRILRVIMSRPNRRAISNAAELVQKFNFDDDLKQYIATRVQKFSKRDRLADDVANDNLGAESGQVEIEVADPAMYSIVANAETGAINFTWQIASPAAGSGQAESMGSAS